MGRPIIGITGELDAARWGDWLREAVISPVSYIRAVDRSGGAPVVLPPVPPPSVAAYIATLDGLVFTGGRDLDPANYDQQRGDDTDEPEHRRDRFELALMRAALEGGVPFLAIGRGLHVLTVARGGTLRTCPATEPIGPATCRTTSPSAPTASSAGRSAPGSWFRPRTTRRRTESARG
jgi:putative glutamine amidotransferase